jgi:hypothetical protein
MDLIFFKKTPTKLRNRSARHKKQEKWPRLETDLTGLGCLSPHI